MDSFTPQAGGPHVKKGHEESDISVRGIFLFVVALVIMALASAVGSWYFLIWTEKLDDYVYGAKLTPMQEQLQKQREEQPVSLSKTPVAQSDEGIKPLPDFYGRKKAEEHLRLTFPTPRLQYDDTNDMDIFRTAEEEWLNTPGKNPDGTVHIPIDQAMDLLAQRGLPAANMQFSGTGPQMPAPVGTQWMEVPPSGATPRPPGTTGGNPR